MFKNINNWPIEHWHIESCSKCSLKCPRCTRQEVPEGLTNKELTLDWFKENFTGKLLQQVKKLTFCGDDGDSFIFSRQSIPLIDRLILPSLPHQEYSWKNRRGLEFPK